MNGARHSNDDDNDERSVESTDSCMEKIGFQSVRNDDDLEEAIVVSWPRHCDSDGDDEQEERPPSRYEILRLTTLLEPEDIAPLFSGAEWAGTRVWHAAVRAIEYLDDEYGEQLRAGATLLELGCGLGVPGMIARRMGAHVTLTDQPQLVGQLTRNVEDNFSAAVAHDDDDAMIRVAPLSWSREGLRKLSSLDASAATTTKFDIVLACDCVFEPLYGDSWRALAETIDEALRMNPVCVVLTSMERRGPFDGVDKFLLTLRELGEGSEPLHATKTEMVRKDEKNNIELYLTTTTTTTTKTTTSTTTTTT